MYQLCHRYLLNSELTVGGGSLTEPLAPGQSPDAAGIIVIMSHVVTTNVLITLIQFVDSIFLSHIATVQYDAKSVT